MTQFTINDAKKYILEQHLHSKYIQFDNKTGQIISCSPDRISVKLLNDQITTLDVVYKNDISTVTLPCIFIDEKAYYQLKQKYTA